MKARQGQTARTAELSQKGLNGNQRKNSKNNDAPNGLHDQQQLNQLRNWFAVANSGDKQSAESGAIIESVAFLQTLVESSPDAIFVKDAQGHYLFSNATFAGWTQKTSNELIGKTDHDLFSPKVAAQFSQSDSLICKEGQALTEEIALENLREGRAETERSLVITKVPFRNRDKQIIGLLGVARDNTVRKLIEEELRESKQFNEQIIASAGEGIVVYDADLRYILWNSFMEEFSGLPSSKVIGRHPMEVFPAIRELGTLELVERALAGETLTGPDFLVNSGQGQKNAWATCRFGPLRDLKGEIIGVIATVNDITERKKIEAALRRSQQFNQQVIANASEGILVCDRELRCMVWNPVLEELSGVEGEEALGRPILELMPRWREAGLCEMLLQALQGDLVESPDLALDPQQQRWVSAKYSPLRDSDEKVIGVIGILAETTARRQAEEALRDSQQFNAQVIDSALEGIAVYDRDLRVVVWNSFMEELTGGHKAQVLGQCVLDLYPHLRETDSLQSWHRALAGETVTAREFQFVDGGERWASASYGPLRNQRGEIVGVIVTMRDITARKMAEEALRASQRFNQQVIDNARDGIIVYDRALRYLVWNPAMEGFSGIPAGALINKKPQEIFPPILENGIYDRLNSALAGATLTRYDYEYDYGTPGGKGHFSRLDAPLRDENGEIVGVISVINEITERKKAEEALRESQQFSQEIVANAREGIVVYDREYRVKVWNHAVEEFSGKRSAEVLGKNVLEVFPQFSGSVLPAHLQTALQGEAQVSEDFQLGPGLDGKLRWLSARYGPHRNSQGEIVGVIATLRDITTSKQALDDLRHSEERYREILYSIQDGYFEIGLLGELNFFNDSLCAICDCKRKELSGAGYLKYLSTSTKKSLRKVFFQVRRTGKSVKAFEFRFISQDGEARALETSITLMHDGAGQACGYRGIIRDVTERKEAEQKIKERDERFRVLIENSYDGIVVMSADGTLLFVSPSYHRIHGYNREEVEGKSALGRIHPDDLSKLQQIRNDLLPGASAKIQYRVLNKAGIYNWLEGTVTNLVEEPSIRGFVINFRDITEQKRAEVERAQAEARLRASETRFRALITHGWEGISLQDAEGELLYVSPSYLRLLGYDDSDVLNSDQLSSLHPEDDATMQAARQEILQDASRQITLEHRIKHKDGTWRWLESRTNNLLADPEVGAIVINFHDITERKLAEQSLRSSEQRFRALVENGYDGISLQDAEGRLTYVSPTYTRIIGYQPEEVLGRSAMERVHPDEVETAERLREEVLSESGARRTMQYRKRHKDGTWRWLEVTLTNLLEDATVGSVVVNFCDITERYQSEQALRESEQKFRAIWDNTQDAMLIVNDEMQYVDANPAACALYGVTREELLRRSMADFVEPGKKETARESLQKLVRRGQRNGHFQLCGADHALREIEYSARANVLPGLHLSVMRDVTERNRAEEALRTSEERYRSLVSVLEEGILMLDPDGELLTCNESAERILGLQWAALHERGRSNPFWQAIQDDGTPFPPDQLPSAITLRTGQPCSGVMMGVVRPAGDICWLSVSSQPVYQQDAEQPHAVVISITDITEQKKAGEALQESEARFSTAFALNPLAVTIVEKQSGQIINVNRAWCEMFGYSAAEAIGHTSLELGLWPDPVARTEMHNQLTACGSLRDYETVHTARDGQVKNVLVSAEQIVLSNKEYFLVLNFDITERKLAEIAVRESEERFSKAFNTSPQPMIIVEFETRRFSNVNEAWLQTFGFSAEEVLGHEGQELNLWEDSADRDHLYELAVSGQPVRNFNTALRHKSGEKRYCIVSVDTIELSGKRYLLSVANDITERKLAEEARRRSEARFAIAFNTCPEPMTLGRLDDGRYVSANRACLRNLGLEERELIGRTPEEINLWADKEQSKQFYDSLLAQGEVRDFECDIFLKGGRVGRFLVSAEIIEIDGVAHVLSVARDITERKRAEEALRASEERFAKAFQSSPQPIAILTMPEGRFVTINEAWVKTLGHSNEETAGHDAEELGLWLDQKQRKRLFSQLEKKGSIRDFDLTLRAKPGDTRHLIVFGEVIQLAGADYLLLTALDNTERKLAEAAQRASEERFSKAFNSSPLLMAISDLDGKVEVVNESLITKLGYTTEEIIGKTPIEFGAWPDPSAKEPIMTELQVFGLVRNFELRLRAKNGEVRDYLYCADVIELAGEPHILCSALDITDRKLVEAALRDSEERYRLLFERNLAGVYRVGVDGAYVDCNEAYANMFGFASRAELMAGTAHALYPAAESWEQLVERLREQVNLTNHEMRLQRKDGSEIWVLANHMLLEGEGQRAPIIEGVVHDITKRKHDEARLAESREQLRALSARLSAIREEERSAVAREIHDSLGQMLTGLKLDVAWVHKRLLAGGKGEALALQGLVEKTESISGLLDNTIQVVRDLATQLRPGVLDTLGLTAAIEWQVQDFQNRTGIECEVWLCPEPKELPKEQATGLFRIVQELLTNIIRHAKATRVVIHLLPTETGLLLSVADNGRGITTGDLKDPKSLGLLGMRERAHMIGGEMKFEGAPERGTTVTITVPLAR